eukprot:gnl/MRDRNA2_/MRDRNA2_22731_c0_seq1.p1 gnl/MRDRNA2_/MRDRNA2_22731_c0~~gnl/MRDRNA2_/MRDRNA2_22731_c0_seq1.p1  ORF type:complete len:238 (+),score=45.04 gnl/MRDRNA2_/MRDRNA2_22731_c0_seq1:327-1040(+)
MIDHWPVIFQGITQNLNNDSWHEKSAKAFFRGEMRGNRKKLHTIANRFPKLFNVSLSQGKKRQDYIKKGILQHGKYVKNPKYEQWRYEVILGGNGGWADRIMEDSFFRMVLLIFDEGCVDFWWPMIKAFQHYVPVRQLEDLVDCINELNHDAESARLIVSRMNDFAQKWLSPDAVNDYSILALRQMANLLTHTNGKVKTAITPEEFVQQWNKMKRRLTSNDAAAGSWKNQICGTYNG